MFAFIVRRLLWAIPVLFFVALVTFFLMHQAPGGPFDADGSNKRVDPATLRALNAKFGLNKPQYVNPSAVAALWAAGERNPLALGRAYADSQFFGYISGALRNDLGPSYRQRGKNVQDILASQWRYSARLALFALAFAIFVGVPLGLIAALRQNSIYDYLSLLFATIGVAVPTFVTGLLVIIVFGTTLKWISISSNNWNTWKPYLAPGLVLGLATMSFITRITRATVLEVKRQDYIRTARAKGLPERTVVLKHAFRNTLIPLVTLFGLTLTSLLSGSVILERIFGWPGIGQLAWQAIQRVDIPIIMGVTVVTACAVVLGNLLADLIAPLIDPRIKVR